MPDALNRPKTYTSQEILNRIFDRTNDRLKVKIAGFSVTPTDGVLSVTNDGTKTTLATLAGDYWRFGDAGVTQHSLDSEDDVLVTGELEVQGASFLDGITTMGANLVVGTIEIDEDSGAVTLVDMSVSASPALVFITILSYPHHFVFSSFSIL